MLTGERTSGGNSGTQDLIAAAIDFEQLAGAAVDLLPNGSVEMYGVRKLERSNTEVNRFGSKREDSGTVSQRRFPLQRAATNHAIIDFASKQIGLSNELRRIRGGGARIDFAGRRNLFEGSVAKQSDAIGESHGLVLVVRDKEESDADFALQGLQLALHLLAQIGVERGERLIEQQELRSIDERAGESDALLLAAAEGRRARTGEAAHFNHAQSFFHASGDFRFRRRLDPETVSDIVANVQMWK